MHRAPYYGNMICGGLICAACWVSDPLAGWLVMVGAAALFVGGYLALDDSRNGPV